MISFILSSFSDFLKKIHLYLGKHRTITSSSFLLLVGLTSYRLFFPATSVVESIVVKKETVRQFVKVSGQVQSSRDASLSFQTVGAVSYLGIKSGDKVRQGQVLATLGGDDAQASLLQAQAGLENAQATLGHLTQGARKEEIAVKQQAFDNANSSLLQAYSAIPDVLQNVDATTADVIKNKLAPLFISTGNRYILSFSSCDQRLQSIIETERSTLETVLEDFQKKNSLVSLISSKETIDKAFESAYGSALATNQLVNSISNLLLTTCSLSNTSLDSQRGILSGVKGSMTALFSDITAKRSAFTTAKNAVEQTSRDLDLTKAGTDPYKLKAQQALVLQAEAQVAQAKSGLSKTIVLAPFSGVISDVSISEGETVSSGKTVITMLALDSFEVEAKVPEIDIVKVLVGGNVEVTLDAYGKAVVFPATVTRINPTATTEGSVPVYKIIVTFIGKDVRIKSGMTANVTIITKEKPDTLILPARFVQVVDTSHGTVVMSRDAKEVIREIELGIRGESGLLEITSGLKEGDVVLAPTTTMRSSQKQAN